MSTDLPWLDPAGQDVVASWFGPVDLVGSCPGGPTGTRVLHLRAGVGDIALTIYGADVHHGDRELDAHEQVLARLAGHGRTPRLLHADLERRLLATTWLPGDVVEGAAAAGDPETYRQAGAVLARLHATGARVDGDWEAAQDARALARLAGAHGIAPPVVSRLREVIGTHAHPPVRVVPCHGDFRPRSWVIDDEGIVRVIDFGRFAWRPPATDLARLDAQQWIGRPDLAAAFVDGYGADPRGGPAWRRILVREAIGTAVWAHRVGDGASEARGRRMIAAALDAGEPAAL
ncbi:phosphotransferase [Isoptericola aurantiacus]|uniref:phosphotransferase n=1 Tax=Isoptericola aurantiacus TaxID=3377839 RepID=UPI003839EFA8